MEKKLRRSHDQFVGGVCAGIGEYFGLDTTLVRVAYAIISFFTGGIAAVFYVVLWMIIPQAQD
jgi:phage shock protein C